MRSDPGHRLFYRFLKLGPDLEAANCKLQQLPGERRQFATLVVGGDRGPEDLPVGTKVYLDSGDGSSGIKLGLGSKCDITGDDPCDILSLVPIFLAFLFGQKFLVRGIATTGGK